jgi:hypothetical protein
MSTNSPLKNESLPARPTAVPDFASWSQVVLAKFAQESHSTMQAQETEIDQLRQDLRMALNAYREVLKK